MERKNENFSLFRKKGVSINNESSTEFKKTRRESEQSLIRKASLFSKNPKQSSTDLAQTSNVFLPTKQLTKLNLSVPSTRTPSLGLDHSSPVHSLYKIINNEPSDESKTMPTPTASGLLKNMSSLQLEKQSQSSHLSVDKFPKAAETIDGTRKELKELKQIILSHNNINHNRMQELVSLMEVVVQKANDSTHELTNRKIPLDTKAEIKFQPEPVVKKAAETLKLTKSPEERICNLSITKGVFRPPKDCSEYEYFVSNRNHVDYYSLEDCVQEMDEMECPDDVSSGSFLLDRARFSSYSRQEQASKLTRGPNFFEEPSFSGHIDRGQKIMAHPRKQVDPSKRYQHDTLREEQPAPAESDQIMYTKQGEMQLRIMRPKGASKKYKKEVEDDDMMTEEQCMEIKKRMEVCLEKHRIAKRRSPKRPLMNAKKRSITNSTQQIVHPTKKLSTSSQRAKLKPKGSDEYVNMIKPNVKGRPKAAKPKKVSGQTFSRLAVESESPDSVQNIIYEDVPTESADQSQQAIYYRPEIAPSSTTQGSTRNVYKNDEPFFKSKYYEMTRYKYQKWPQSKEAPVNPEYQEKSKTRISPSDDGQKIQSKPDSSDQISEKVTASSSSHSRSIHKETSEKSKVTTRSETKTVAESAGQSTKDLNITASPSSQRSLSEKIIESEEEEKSSRRTVESKVSEQSRVEVTSSNVSKVPEKEESIKSPSKVLEKEKESSGSFKVSQKEKESSGSSKVSQKGKEDSIGSFKVQESKKEESSSKVSQKEKEESISSTKVQESKKEDSSSKVQESKKEESSSKVRESKKEESKGSFKVQEKEKSIVSSKSVSSQLPHGSFISPTASGVPVTTGRLSHLSSSYVSPSGSKPLTPKLSVSGKAVEDSKDEECDGKVCAIGKTKAPSKAVMKPEKSLVIKDGSKSKSHSTSNRSPSLKKASLTSMQKKEVKKVVRPTKLKSQSKSPAIQVAKKKHPRDSLAILHGKKLLKSKKISSTPETVDIKKKEASPVQELIKETQTKESIIKESKESESHSKESHSEVAASPSFSKVKESVKETEFKESEEKESKTKETYSKENVSKVFQFKEPQKSDMNIKVLPKTDSKMKSVSKLKSKESLPSTKTIQKEKSTIEKVSSKEKASKPSKDKLLEKKEESNFKKNKSSESLKKVRSIEKLPMKSIMREPSNLKEKSQKSKISTVSEDRPLHSILSSSSRSKTSLDRIKVAEQPQVAEPSKKKLRARDSLAVMKGKRLLKAKAQEKVKEK